MKNQLQWFRCWTVMKMSWVWLNACWGYERRLSLDEWKLITTCRQPTDYITLLIWMLIRSPLFQFPSFKHRRKVYFLTFRRLTFESDKWTSKLFRFFSLQLSQTASCFHGSTRIAMMQRGGRSSNLSTHNLNLHEKFKRFNWNSSCVDNGCERTFNSRVMGLILCVRLFLDDFALFNF